MALRSKQHVVEGVRYGSTVAVLCSMGRRRAGGSDDAMLSASALVPPAVLALAAASVLPAALGPAPVASHADAGSGAGCCAETSGYAAATLLTLASAAG